MAGLRLNLGVAAADGTFAEELRRSRHRAGLTQDQLAERARISLNAVSALERGVRRRPYEGTVRALGTALGLTAPECDGLVALSRAARRPAAERAEPAMPVPRQLPAAIGNLTGRIADLARLDTFLPEPGADPSSAVTVAISGTAGVGKTTLAVAWAHRVRDRFPDGQFYVNLRGYDPGAPADPAEVLEHFLRALDVPAAKIPVGVEQRAALFRSLTDGARLLMVLDNAGSAEQVRPLLPGSAPALVVVTSRASLTGLAVSTGAATLSLGLLPTADAEALLRSIVGSARADAEAGAIADLARLCARLPLALQLGGQRAAAYPDLPLAHLVGELAREPGRIALLSSGADESTAVDAVFSWSYRDLPAGQSRLFRLLGVHPGPDIAVAAAAALAGLRAAETHGLLRGLADARLVEPAAPGRFRMHDLLHAYARQLAEEDGLGAALPRLVGHYLHAAASADRALHPARGPVPVDGAPSPAEGTAFAGYDEALRWCEWELPVVVAVVRAAAEHGLTAAAWQLPNAMWSFFYLTKYRTQWAETHWIGLRAAERAGDVAGRARLLNGLAAGSGIEEAEGMLLAASAGFRAAGDLRGEASALVNLGDAYLRAGRPAESVTHSAAALEIVRGTGNRYVEATAVCNLGEAHLELGRPAEAVAAFTDALALCRAGGNRVGEAVALVHLGEAYLQLRRHDEAALHLGRGLAMCRDNGDRHGEARALVALGQVHHDTAALAAARDCWEQALEILTATDDERAGRIRERLRRLAAPTVPGGRRPAGEPLTPAEGRIAALAASGLTNREVAEIARVSHKTVEVNLSRVYRKLGIRNRTELANRLGDHAGRS